METETGTGIKAYSKLKGLIVEKEFSQTRLASKLNIDRSTLSCKLNRTKGRDLSFSEAIKIAEILDVNVSDFY